MKRIPTIHRDGTFTYKGVTYGVMEGSPTPTEDGSRFVVRFNSFEPGDWDVVAESFGYYSEIRAWLRRAVDEDWPDLDEAGAARAYFQEHGQ